MSAELGISIKTWDNLSLDGGWIIHYCRSLFLSARAKCWSEPDFRECNPNNNVGDLATLKTSGPEKEKEKREKRKKRRLWISCHERETFSRRDFASNLCMLGRRKKPSSHFKSKSFRREEKLLSHLPPSPVPSALYIRMRDRRDEIKSAHFQQVTTAMISANDLVPVLVLLHLNVVFFLAKDGVAPWPDK